MKMAPALELGGRGVRREVNVAQYKVGLGVGVFVGASHVVGVDVVVWW